MTDQSLLITNALICNEGRVTAGDVLMRRGRIEKVAREIPAGRVELLTCLRGTPRRAGSTCGPV